MKEILSNSRYKSRQREGLPEWASTPRLEVARVVSDSADKFLERTASEINALSSERPTELAGTSDWVNYFDANWQKEGLPEDWYNLKSQLSKKRVGFVIKRQMDLLKDPTNRENVLDWAQKTKRDLQGFKLEFLSDHIVYPRKYHIVRNANEPARIEDPLYGKAKDSRYQHEDIAEIISEEERNGSVKRAMKEIKSFLVDAPVGSMTVLTSPLGPTGFKTDDGLGIDYPDTYFFVKVKTSPNEIMNYTIKTNFNLAKSRAVIKQLTGIELPANAPLEDYAGALARITSGEQSKFQNIFDVINVLQEVHPKAPFIDKQNGKVTSWREVFDDIAQGEQLYEFDKKTTKVLEDFSTYAKADVARSLLDQQKGIAATILNMADIFFTPEEEKNVSGMVPNEWVQLDQKKKSRFGDILDKAAARRGCTGSGGDTAVTVNGLTVRTGTVRGGENSSEGFSCPKCPFKAAPGEKVGNQCPGCGLTKEAYAEETGVSCD